MAHRNEWLNVKFPGDPPWKVCGVFLRGKSIHFEENDEEIGHISLQDVTAARYEHETRYMRRHVITIHVATPGFGFELCLQAGSREDQEAWLSDITDVLLLCSPSLGSLLLDSGVGAPVRGCVSRFGSPNP